MNDCKHLRCNRNDGGMRDFMFAEVALCLFVAIVVVFGAESSYSRYQLAAGALLAVSLAVDTARLRFAAIYGPAIRPLVPWFLLAAYVLILSFGTSIELVATCVQVTVLAAMGSVIAVVTRRTWSIEFGLLVGILYIAAFGRHTQIPELRYTDRFIYDLSLGSDGWLNPNVYALYCSLYVALAIRVWALRANAPNAAVRPGTLRLVITAVGALVACHEIVVRTGSRKGMLILFLLFIGGLVLVTRTYRGVARLDPGHILLAALVGAGGGMGAYLLLRGTEHFDRLLILSNLFSGRGAVDASAVGRSRLAACAFDIWLSNPLFGGGANAVRERAGVYAHSNPLELLADFGLCGFVLYYAVPARIVVRCLRGVRNAVEQMTWLPLWLILLFATLMLFDLFAVTYTEKIPALMFGVLTGLTARGRLVGNRGGANVGTAGQVPLKVAGVKY